ncbi:hypothetical protein GIB67_017875 [Kingdonia uniflora]|uniref:Uncharacterized protein n=1 Tax=Kingdonia uniflora TaxID=39325 RepID=A0A7J7ML74_9MAGN|nr:hypothetical protein GIB67_017875 [Kingdonia uniflora]
MWSCGVHALAAGMYQPSSRARHASEIVSRMLERHLDNLGYSIQNRQQRRRFPQ